jgi:xanthine/uracil permease
MSIIIATIFVVAVQWTPVLKRHWVKAGLVYGMVVFAVMNYVVLPLSAVGHAPRFRIVHFIEDILAMLLFGLIIAFFARQRPDR